MNIPTFGSWLELFTEPVLEQPDEGRIDVRKPTYPEDIPKLDLPIQKIYDYFVDLVDGRFMIDQINGIFASAASIRCDYCYLAVPHLYCTECKKYMCRLCSTEKTLEDALKNGAKNWHKRKDVLLKCFSHSEKLEYNRDLPVYCDSCRVCSTRTFGTWMCNRKDDKDLCPSCVKTEAGRKMMETHNFQPVEMTEYAFKTGFGSLLDWIPAYEDPEREGTYILVNVVNEPGNVAVVVFRGEGDLSYYRLSSTPYGVSLKRTLQDIISDIKKEGITKFLEDQNILNDDS